MNISKLIAFHPENIYTILICNLENEFNNVLYNLRMPISKKHDKYVNINI